MEKIKVKGYITAINVVDNVANIRLKTFSAENQSWTHSTVFKYQDLEFVVTFGYNTTIRPEAISSLHVNDAVEIEVHKANEISYSVKSISRTNSCLTLIGWLSEIDKKQRNKEVPEAYFDERPGEAEEGADEKE